MLWEIILFLSIPKCDLLDYQNKKNEDIHSVYYECS